MAQNEDALARKMFKALQDSGQVLDASYTGIVGLVVSLMRREKDLSQSQLAKMSGVSQPTISRIEMGECDITLPQIDAISSALGTSPGEITDVADRFRNILKQQNISVTPSNKSGYKAALAGAAVTTGALLGGGPIGLLVGAVLGAMISSRKEK